MIDDRYLCGQLMLAHERDRKRCLSVVGAAPKSEDERRVKGCACVHNGIICIQNEYSKAPGAAADIYGVPLPRIIIHRPLLFLILWIIVHTQQQHNPTTDLHEHQRRSHTPPLHAQP